MKKQSKRFRTASSKIDRSKSYSLSEAVKLLRENATAKFDETVELATRLGVDTRHADQNIRGTVSLPHGTGKKIRVIVFAQGEQEEEAIEAGADLVGVEELVDKIVGGWLEFDVAIAVPNLMRQITPKLGRILGPRGLMPNSKTGTVTMNIKETIEKIKAGQIEYRAEKESGVVHVLAGKVSFDNEKIEENIQTIVNALIKARPASTKGKYLKNISISSTMGAGIRLDPGQFS